MSDQSPRELDVSQLVLQSSDDVWKRLKQALGVSTREEAATLAQTDERVRKVVMELLGGQAAPEGKSLLSRAGGQQTPPGTMLGNSYNRPTGQRNASGIEI